VAQWAVAQRSATINLACRAFGISQTCYRYKAKLDEENSLIADWLVRLTNNQRNWGFGLCFLYLLLRVFRAALHYRITPGQGLGQQFFEHELFLN
jgi:hypothetical protein